MFKFIIAFETLPKLSRKQCQDYLASQHGPLVASIPEFCRHVRGYVQSYALDIDVIEHTDFDADGAAELWFDDLDGFVTAYAEPQYLSRLRPDESRFAHPERLVVAFASEVTLITSDAPANLKLMRFLAASPDQSAESAKAEWRGIYEHALINDSNLRSLIVRYIQNWSVPMEENPFPIARPFIGVQELWFRSEQDLRAFIAGERNLLERCEQLHAIDFKGSPTIAAREKRVLPATL